MKWNDMRIVGPLLLAMFAMVTFMSPNFVGATNGVGNASCFDTALLSGVDVQDTGGDEGDPRLVAWTGGCDPCYDGPNPTGVVALGDCDPCSDLPASAGGPVLGEEGCCIPVAVVGGGPFGPCDEPETDGEGAEGEEEDEGAPAVKLPPPPDPIIGPIWLGAIQVDASIPGLVTLTFPDLLDAFIENNIVRVYDADDALVFKGHIGADGTILVFSDNAPMLVKTTLTTRAPYYETVGASTTS